MHANSIRPPSAPLDHPRCETITTCKAPQPDKLTNKQFNFGNAKIGTISPIASIKCSIARYTTTIAPSRKESIESEKSDKADFKIFSDGFGHKNRIGSAAIL